MKKTITRFAVATKGGFRLVYEKIVEKPEHREIKQPEIPRKRINMYV